jgi:hypothetical protein
MPNRCKPLILKTGSCNSTLATAFPLIKMKYIFPGKIIPTVKQAALGPLKKYIDKVTLINEDGIITEIDVFIMKEASEVYMDKLMQDAYGKGVETPNLDKYQEGTHLTYATWKGRRVTAMILQTNFNRRINTTMVHGRIQSIVFTKTSDAQIDGPLPDGFGL